MTLIAAYLTFAVDAFPTDLRISSLEPRDLVTTNAKNLREHIEI